MSGIFHTPPPVFIGGRQPYAPRQGRAQSGPTPEPPPRRTWAVLGVILTTWLPPAYALPKQVRIAPLIPPPAVVTPPPPADRRNLRIIDQVARYDPVVKISLASSAPVLPPPDVAPLIDRRQHELIRRAWEPYHPRQREKTAAQFPRVDVAPLKLRTNIDIAIQQWIHVHPLLQQRKVAYSGPDDQPQAYGGKSYRPRTGGIFRKVWNYAERIKHANYQAPPSGDVVNFTKPTITFAPQVWDIVGTGAPVAGFAYRPRINGIYRKVWKYSERIRRDLLPHVQSSSLTTATITFNPRVWTIVGVPLPGQGTSSIAPVPRVGIYRKTWNYAERNSQVSIFWLEQSTEFTLDLTSASFSFTTNQWAISTTADYLVTITRPTFTIVPLQWAISGATNVTNLTRAQFTFSALQFDIQGQGPIVIGPDSIGSISFSAVPLTEILFSAAPQTPAIRIRFSAD